MDHAVMFAAGVVLLPLARSGMRLNRLEAALLLTGYLSYVAIRLLAASSVGN